MAMSKPFRWSRKAGRIITDYQEGQTENKNQNNCVFMGTPRTGKNHLKNIIEEWAMRGDHAKVIFPHASQATHLEEIFRFMLPNGYHDMKEGNEALETLKKNLREAEYSTHTIVEGDLIGIKDQKWDKRVDVLQDLIEKEDNRAILDHLRTARDAYQEVADIAGKTEEMAINNDDIPRSIDKVYDDGLGALANFNVKVFAPISSSMPQGVEFPDIFEPYAIPVDDFKKYNYNNSLKIIFGDSGNYDKYRELYDRAIDIGDSDVTDLKAPEIDDKRDYVDSVSFGDMDYSVFNPPENAKQVMGRFKMAWSRMFNKQGIICSSDFDKTLREPLKKHLLDDETDIVVLYTGFINNTGLQKFCMTHFMETYESIMDGLSPQEQEKLDRKNIIDLLEAQEIVFRKTQYNNLTNQDKQFNRFLSGFINQAGHMNSDVFADTKPRQAHPLLLSTTEHTWITKIQRDDWEDLFKKIDNDLQDKAKRAFQNRDYSELENSEFGMGFILWTEGRVIDWQKSKDARYMPNTSTYGYRHFCSRMSETDPVPFSNDNPSFLNEELGFQDNDRTFKFDKYVRELFEDDWDSDREAISDFDEKREKEKQKQKKEEKEKKELIKEKINQRIRSYVYELGEIPSSWSDIHKEIIEDENLDYERRTVREWTEDVRNELEEEFEADVDIDPYQLGEELREVSAFAFAGSMKSMEMRCKEYLIKERGIDREQVERIDDDTIDTAVRKAIADLQDAGVLNKQMNVKLEGENREQQKDRFRELVEKEKIAPTVT